jgi:hypothetical protein
MKLNIVIDESNPIYQLLKLLGCDLAQETMNKYDAIILGLQFVFACFMLYLFCKMIYNMMIRMTRCVSSI